MKFYLGLSLARAVAPFNLCNAALIFSESMGTVSGTTAIATHETNNGFDRDDFTFSGTGDVRTTTVSNYPGASGEANVFLTNNGTASLTIAGIDTSEYDGTFTLKFGALKSTAGLDLSSLLLSYSEDGNTFTSIPFTASTQTGAGATWRLITLTDVTLPTVSNLRLRWLNPTTGTGVSFQARIDDISLEGTQIPEPSSVLLTLMTATAVGAVAMRKRLG